MKNICLHVFSWVKAEHTAITFTIVVHNSCAISIKISVIRKALKYTWYLPYVEKANKQMVDIIKKIPYIRK